jgi:glutamine synthetase
MADRTLVKKILTKHIAHQHGKSITYMAKIHEDEPGNGCHIHLSLKTPEGKNAFTGNEALGAGVTCSVVMK